MREYSFTNYIEIDGKDVPMDSLGQGRGLDRATSTTQ